MSLETLTLEVPFPTRAESCAFILKTEAVLRSSLLSYKVTPLLEGMSKGGSCLWALRLWSLTGDGRDSRVSLACSPLLGAEPPSWPRYPAAVHGPPAGPDSH